MRAKDKHKHIWRIKWLVRSKFDEKYKSIYKRNSTNVKDKKQEENHDTGKRRYLKPIVNSSMEKRHIINTLKYL